jgi:hypothetical protein
MPDDQRTQMPPEPLTSAAYLDLCEELRTLGYGDDREWAESVRMPDTPEEFACEYTWVVLNSGMKNTVARRIMDRVWPTLLAGRSAGTVFGHAAKAAAIDQAWSKRAELHRQAKAADDLVAFCRSLPWIGPVTCWHLAKNLGADVAKPDRWLLRLADSEGTTPEALCRRIADATGDRIATVDVVLWRACALGLIVAQKQAGKEDRNEG